MNLHSNIISKEICIRVITKLPNTEQSSKGKVKTHKSINRQNQSTTGKLGNRNGTDLIASWIYNCQQNIHILVKKRDSNS